MSVVSVLSHHLSNLPTAFLEERSRTSHRPPLANVLRVQCLASKPDVHHIPVSRRKQPLRLAHPLPTVRTRKRTTRLQTFPIPAR
eukprot:3332203-Rhodomonas_salina.3